MADVKPLRYHRSGANVIGFSELRAGETIAVTEGGTGRATGTTPYALVATGTTATGAQQTLANGATTEVLVGGGPSALPVWTTATGTGAPVRATSPNLVTPTLGAATATSINSTTIPASKVLVTTETLNNPAAPLPVRATTVTASGAVSAAIFANPRQITTDVTLPSDYNALSVVPITVSQGATVYVGQGTVWRFLNPASTATVA